MHDYSDDDPNYLEEHGLALPAYLERASHRLGGLFRRLRRDYRHVLQPMRYEAYLAKLQGVLGMLHGGHVDAASWRMNEISAMLDAELPYEGDPAAHRYSDDGEDFDDVQDEGFYNLRQLDDTALRLSRLRKRLRGLRGKIEPHMYEVYSHKIRNATLTFKGDVQRACGAAEEAMRLIKADLEAQIEVSDDWMERIAAERRASSPTFAENEARIEAAGGGWVVERPVEHEDGEIEWTIVAEG